MNEPTMEEIDQHIAEHYTGPCPLDQYTPPPPDKFFVMHGGLSVQSDLNVPSDDSYWYMNAYEYEVEGAQDLQDGQGEVARISKGYTFPNQAKLFVDNCPVADTEQPFRVRARARWRTQDHHPLNFGYIVHGPTYSGHWSDWSAWQQFEDAIPVGVDLSHHLKTFWTVTMRASEIVFDDDSNLAERQNEVSGLWRGERALYEELSALFILPDGTPAGVHTIEFEMKRDRIMKVNFSIPCEKGQVLTVLFTGKGYDTEYSGYFAGVTDPRYWYVPEQWIRSEGATLEFALADGAIIEPQTDEPTSNIRTDEDAQAEFEGQQEKEPQQEETEMDPIYGEDTQAQVAELVAELEAERAEAQANRDAEQAAVVNQAVTQRINDDRENIKIEVRAEIEAEQETPVDNTDELIEAEFATRREAVKAEMKARLSGAGGGEESDG